MRILFILMKKTPFFPVFEEKCIRIFAKPTTLFNSIVNVTMGHPI